MDVVGDTRFEPALDAILRAGDRAGTIRGMDDEAVVAALAAASRAGDPLMANVLETEAENRIRRLRAGLAHMREGVAILDPDGRVVWLNPHAEGLLGVRREDAAGKDLHVLVDHRDLRGELVPHEACAILNVARSGVAVEREEEVFVRLDNSRLCVAYTSSPTRQRDGSISGMVLAFRDCTQRRRNDEVVREAEQRYRSLFDNLPIAVVSLDANGTILDSNPCAERLTGRPRSEARGHSFLAFLRAEEARDAASLFREVVAGAHRSTPVDILRRDGSYVRVDVLGIPVEGGAGDVRVHCLLQTADATLPAPIEPPAEGKDVAREDRARDWPQAAPAGRSRTRGNRTDDGQARANVETRGELPRP